MKKNIDLMLILFLIFAGLALNVSCSKPQEKTPESPAVSTTTEASAPATDDMAVYENAVREGKAVVIDFTSPSCGACQQLEPILEEAKKEWKDKVIFVTFDLGQDKYREYAVKSGVRVTPTLHFVGKNGKVNKEILGVTNKKVIDEEIEKITQ